MAQILNRTDADPRESTARRPGEVAEELRWVLEAMQGASPLDAGLSAAEMRVQSEEMWRAAAPLIELVPPAEVTTEDHSISVAGGEVVARLYRPAAPISDGCHVYFHGGAYWLGSVEQDDNRCRWLAASSGVPILSVGYRLAPEHRYPTPIDDCITSVRWVRLNAPFLGIDPVRVSVGGESAGGHAAAMTALHYAEHDASAGLLAQVLNVPLVDFADPVIYDADHDPRCTPSSRDSAEMRDFFLGADSGADVLTACSPARQRVDHLPPTYVITAQFDLLRDQGLAYAARVAAAGIEVHTYHAADLFHGGSGLAAFSPSARRCEAVHAGFVRRAHLRRERSTD
ncbi:alpha/beta hydrolase [Marmoricola sp. RAF53]|uniref:alpha/beta hydrolase n=1 Tax=Marmoricola sp. RAF53 TaxID=3233059 RepID=UPI003F9DB512